MHFLKLLIPIVMCVSVLTADPRTSQAYVFPGPAGEIFVLDAKTASITGIIGTPFLGRAPGAAAFSPDGMRLYCILSFGIFVVDSLTNTVMDWIPIDPSILNDIAISSDGNTAWVADQFTGSAIEVDLNSKQVLGTVSVGSSPIAIAMTNDGSRVYVADQSSALVLRDRFSSPCGLDHYFRR
jgi:DNA-binding beta-propeller fold protein YncE